jgi:1-deoxy-D-xylulose-5-phosphate synthase
VTQSLLDRIHSPVDLRRLAPDELVPLADELREEIVRCVSQTGGHFSSNLGSVELTIALHYAFETPRDLLVWDVGHQTYPHKILTGRRDRMHTLRQYGGLSGFCLKSESEYDVLAAGHASTSISAALGLAVARDLRGESHHVVAVIGDGSMTAGMAFEAMNQAGHLGSRLIVVLNDNSMSISPSVGALTKYLEALMAGRHYAKLKDDVKRVLHKIPGIGDPMLEVAKGLEEGVRQVFTPGTLFEELGFRYVGPVNGHSVPALLDALAEAKSIDGPVLLHAQTKKGKGYKYAEDEPVEYHGPSAFDPVAGIQKKKPATPAAPTYTAVFGKAVVKLAEHDPRVVAITASMPDGTGLVPFSEKFPDRFLNTGIAEQHSVTLAGGLAMGGIRPVVAIYSSFLQRGFDQIFHDVCLMDLPVTFALDRAGIAGNDGWTHHGLFDFAYFRIFPNTIVMAPKDENELQHMLATAIAQDHPTAVRYPRGNGVGVPLDAEFRQLPLGKAEVLRRGRHGLIWAVGTSVPPALEAAERLAREGTELTVVNARFVKPLDRELLKAQLEQLGVAGARLATVEEHVVAGGFGSAVTEALAELELHGVETSLIGVPDKFVPHGSQEILRKVLGLDADGLYFRFRAFFARAAGAARPTARATGSA